MMDLNQWEQAVKLHLDAIEVLLKNVLKKQYNVTLKEVDTGSNEDAAKQIKQAGKVIRFVEKNFQSEIFLSFSDTWVSQLTDQLLNSQAKNEKSIDDLVIEFSTNLTDMISGALAEVGVEIEMANFTVIEEEKLSRAFNLQHYFRANLHATAAGDNENEAQPFLELRMAASHPDKETSEAYEKTFNEDNPFEDNRYTEAVKRFAQHAEMTEAGEPATEGEYNGGVSEKGKSVEFEDFGKSKSVNNNREVRNIDILKDVEMNLSVELGRREMPLGNILQLVKGSVIELEKLAGEPVEILVNGHKIAQGDVVVIDEHFGVRISNLLASQERLKQLQ